MRAMLVLVIAMGVLIVAGVATIAITIVHRAGVAPMQTAVAANTTLDEPAGTHIASVAGVGTNLALVLEGGGPSRVVVVDPSTGRRLGTVRLAR